MITKQEYVNLVQMYIDTVYRVAMGYMKNPTDADDITQNVFLILWEKSKPFENPEHARNWLIRVTVNECKKWLRAPWRKRVSFEEYAQTLHYEDPAGGEVLREVMALPVKYRLPLYLHYYEGYSTGEIADILKMPKGTVCTNLNRGGKMLKHQLQEVE